MRDMKQGINKAIADYEEDVKLKSGEELKDWNLSDESKELIEHGYIQCSLQIGYDIVTKGESFMVGLQEMVLENDELKRKLEKYKDIKEIIARNILAWDTSKDKTQGLLPEVYLSDKYLFTKLTGEEPIYINLLKYAKIN